MYGPHPWVIRSRVAMVSQPTKCALPYVVRGVAIGVDGNRNLSCGAVTVTNQLSGPVPIQILCNLHSVKKENSLNSNGRPEK